MTSESEHVETAVETAKLATMYVAQIHMGTIKIKRGDFGVLNVTIDRMNHQIDNAIRALTSVRKEVNQELSDRMSRLETLKKP